MFTFITLRHLAAATALAGAISTCSVNAEACGSRSCACPCNSGCGMSMPVASPGAMPAMPMEEAAPVPPADSSTAPAVDHSQHTSAAPRVSRYRSAYQAAPSGVPSFGYSAPGRSGSSHSIQDQIGTYRRSLGKPF
jgi:hypothetical protein